MFSSTDIVHIFKLLERHLGRFWSGLANTLPSSLQESFLKKTLPRVFPGGNSIPPPCIQPGRVHWHRHKLPHESWPQGHTSCTSMLTVREDTPSQASSFHTSLNHHPQSPTWPSLSTVAMHLQDVSLSFSTNCSK